MNLTDFLDLVTSTTSPAIKSKLICPSSVKCNSVLSVNDLTLIILLFDTTRGLLVSV